MTTDYHIRAENITTNNYDKTNNMKKTLLMIITLLCTVAQGTWGQTTVKNENELGQAVKTNGANIVMLNDIELSHPVIIQNDNGGGVTVTINMNGKKLTYKTALGQNEASCVFAVPSGSTLNLSNGTIADVDNNGDNNTVYVAGAIVNDGTATLTEVTITGCKGLTGGAIKNNQRATLTLNSCILDGNEAVTKQNVGDSGNGGAIWNNGKIVINSSTITGNKASVHGGAIWNGGVMSMQGVITVKENTGADNAADNVYMKSGRVINVTGSLEGSDICVRFEGTTGLLTSGYGSNSSGVDPGTVFTSDIYPEFYGVTLSGNEAVLALRSPIPITEEGLLRRALDLLDDFSVKLFNDIDLSNSTLSIASGKTVTIDLGGFTLDRKLKKRGEGGGQVITVRNGATLNLSNGTLKGGWGGDSGGINNEGGTANLTDVTITGCTGDDRGGGICNRTGSTLTMTGGAITGNISNDHTTPEGGGALFNAEGATATLTGVTITGNKAKVKGGGALCNYGTMTLDGCTITGNSCQINGGGIWTAASATLNMLGEMTVTDNTSANGVTNNLFLKTGAVITVTGSLAGSQIGINLESVLGTFTVGYKQPNGSVSPASVFIPDIDTFFDVTPAGDEAALTLQPLISVANNADLRTAVQFDGANIQLANDIKLSNSTLEIKGNTTVTIDLNGKTLNRGLTSRDFDNGGQVITVRKGATLNLSNGTLTGGWGGNGGGLANEEGTATLTDVTITGCTGDQRGGGISNYGTLTMTGGSLTGNTSNDIKASSSDLTAGGGIFTSKGSTTTLTGVTITGNKNKIYGGGGICNFGTLNIDGCTITGNTAGANGGAIWQEGTLNLQGKNTITDNQAGGRANNVYLYYTVITVTGSLDGSNIGVRMEKPGIFTSGYSTYNEGLLPVQVFQSDNDDYTVILRDNEAELKKKMGDDTGIRDINRETINNNGETTDNKRETINNKRWFTLDGRRLNGKPTTKGVFLNNGLKVLIK